MSQKLSFYERQHLERLLQQQGSIKYIFDDFIRKVGVHMSAWKDTGASDVWIRNKTAEKAIDTELQVLHDKIVSNIDTYTTDAWNRAHTKIDDLVSSYIEGMPIGDVAREGMFTRNQEAFKAFMNRKVDGADLSSRVWKTIGTAKDNMEHYLASGLATGRQASSISQDIRQLLKDPDKRFHRIRNADGKLVPSSPMKDYHPGQGVYRSSYKNALRLSVTNTNEMYRTADHDRWQNLDFVLGVEIKRSASNKGPCPVCDAMVGKYPKDFVFKGWHPWCICVATPILMDDDDFMKSIGDDNFKPSGQITDIPKNSRAYLDEQLEKDNVSLDSYLFKDNKKFFDGSMRTSSATMPKQTIRPFKPAKTLKEAKEWALSNLDVEYADFTGLDINVANDINKSVYKIKQLMPNIRTSGVGSAQAANKAMKSEILDAYRKTDWYKSVIKQWGPDMAEKSALKAAGRQISNVGPRVIAWSTGRTGIVKIHGIEVDLSKYNGVYVNQKYGKKGLTLNADIKRMAESGWYTKDANDFGYIMSHEIGHEIDRTIGLRDTPEFKAIYSREHSKGIKHVIENLSEYGATAGGKASGKPAEMIAEAWAEFVTSNNPRPIAKEIGELMLKQYHKKNVMSSGIDYDEWKNEIVKILKQ